MLVDNSNLSTLSTPCTIIKIICTNIEYDDYVLHYVSAMLFCKLLIYIGFNIGMVLAY
jgi:hypothetical protein